MSTSAAIADPLLRHACGRRARPSIPRPRSGSSLSGVEGSTMLGTLSLSNGRRTVVNNAG
ncbi:MAG: hypothetical protein OEY86_10880 [Nitrospira sp.]|nr:hypothetical protein [Nitrospira sp.]